MNCERITVANILNHLTQQIAMADKQVVVFTFEQVNREEIGATWVPGAAVIRLSKNNSQYLRCSIR